VEQRRKPEGANFQCAKCHLNYGREPTPKSHSDLFPAK
jgi:cytochrome c